MSLLRRKNYSINENAPWKAARNFFNFYTENIKTIGLYWPILYELDTRPLIKLLLEKKVDVLLPSVTSNQLKFLQWNFNEKLTYNRLKFYEPEQISIQKIPEVILTPLLAFDKKGYRLGFGKGFYDKFFEKNKHSLYLGYGYDFQELDNLPFENFDLKCNAIITDKSVKDFNS